MGIEERIQRTLSRGRSRASALMTSRCNVRREGGLADQDLETGMQPRTWTVVHENEPVDFVSGRRGAAQSRSLSAPGGDVDMPLGFARFRWDLPGIKDGDLIEITTGVSAGVVLRVIEATSGDRQTALRVPVIGAQRPDEWDEEES